MEIVKVIVHGATGRMGQEVIKTLCQEPDMAPVGAVDFQVKGEQLSLPDGSGSIPLSGNLDDILDRCKPDVMIDFTIAKATMAAVHTAAKNKVNMVIGTTGLGETELDEIRTLATTSDIGVVVAPNFALGAVLMMHLSGIAAKYVDYAEIIELHHDQKKDAPSGTALLTAKKMAESRGKPFKLPLDNDTPPRSRGEQVEGVSIHSVRLPGLLAHQEVILGIAGQTLRIRHDTVGRECYMPGVMIATREVMKRKGLILGLASLLGLQEA